MHKNNPKIRLEKRFISITYKMRRNVRQLISSWIWIQVFMVTHVRFLLEQLLVGVRHPVKLFWNREFEAYSIQLNSDFAVALKNEVEYWAKISYHNFSISNRVRILTKLSRCMRYEWRRRSSVHPYLTCPSDGSTILKSGTIAWRCLNLSIL